MFQGEEPAPLQERTSTGQAAASPGLPVVTFGQIAGSSQAWTTVNRGETGCRGVGAEGAKSRDVCRERERGSGRGGGGGRETPGKRP